MLISSKQVKLTVVLHLINTEIQQVTSVRYPGVSVAADLSWATHITSTIPKAKQHLGIPYWHFNLASLQAKYKIYCTTIISLLDYCSSIWYHHEAKYIQLLESV